MKKGGFLRNVLDTIRSNQASNQGNRGHYGGPADRNIEYGGQLKPSHFALGQVARHGFPENPTALAFDPVQKIAAIGTKSGAMRIFGRPGVDVWAQHEPAFAVTHIKFIVNQGAIITVTADESLHLWSLRGPNLKLQFSSSGQGSSGLSLSAACSPAPTLVSNISSVSPQSGSSSATTAGTSSTTPSSILGQITDTVTGAVDSASDFLSGGGSGDHHQSHQATPSPTITGGDSAMRACRLPELMHTLKFQREHITCIHRTISSKWLYIGTERGNVHIANVETFELSGYSIAWNKAIELSRKTHPGAIIHLSECPQDTNKLLIGYESGCIAIWDLRQRNADGRYYHTENLLWLAWHYEGKQFVAAHGDGSLITWHARSNAKPAQILYPHAKTVSSGACVAGAVSGHQQQQDSTISGAQQSHSLASSIARSFNNELYRPINKVDWKTSKSTNEQFLLFSGGLPYDSAEHFVPLQQPPLAPGSNEREPSLTRQPSSGSSARFSATGSTSQHQALLKATSGQSPISPSVSPNLQQQQQQQQQHETNRPGSTNRQQIGGQLSHREKRKMRSTSLTVMFGKSITVLEMDDMIVDFITVCDNSPYENDTSDPYAVIVLLSNELVIIDLTSPGYPSFDTPYPSAGLNESPVTCIQYLADCPTDLIPFLYSTSQNAVSRAPKKGFSDKEWPINGGEWGQSMQSYPELVLTGHADGTIKFWDISAINFDLISKIKTSKLFEKPNKLSGATILITSPSNLSANSNSYRRPGTSALRSSPPFKVGQAQQQHSDNDHCSSSPTETSQTTLLAAFNEPGPTKQTALDESLFAIEKMEFCPISKRLLVAGAFSQVIQFKLNKKDSHTSGGAASSSGGELTTILVEPTYPQGSSDGADHSSGQQHQAHTIQNQQKQHLLLRARDSHGTTSSSSGGSSSSSTTQRSRGLSGFQAELVCLTPLLLSTNAPTDDSVYVLGSICGTNASSSSPLTYYCQMPPKISALVLQATHNILAYSHENGIVLVDVIQKCLIMNATLSDLYGGLSMINASRDVSIQPFATSSILQHHYLATGSTAAGQENESNNNKLGDNGNAILAAGTKISPNSDNSQKTTEASYENVTSFDGSPNPDNGQPKQFSGITSGGVGASSRHQKQENHHHQQQQQQQQPVQSRYTTNSMFQRQLSTNALSSGGQTTPSAQSAASSGAQGHLKPAAVGQRLFQRQMTATQLSTGGSLSSSGQQLDSGGKRLLGNVRADPSLASSMACLLGTASSAAGGQPSLGKGRTSGTTAALSSSATGQAAAAAAAAPQTRDGVAKKPAKNKRIISRMLSISAIHTNVGSGSTTNIGPEQQQHNAELNVSTSTGYSSDDATSQMNEPQGTSHLQRLHASGNEHIPDKFSDSTFARSRSSSSSSVTQPGGASQQQQQNQAPPGASCTESIQCISFLDPARAAAPAAALLASAAAGSSPQQASGAAQSSSASSGGTSGHKSLSSIDTNAGGQLALWIGTSSGSVLLVNLTLPDTEDNRILQLQSINAEPIPQASIKLSGQILALEAFVCEQKIGTELGHYRSGTMSVGQQLSSGSGQACSFDLSAPEAQGAPSQTSAGAGAASGSASATGTTAASGGGQSVSGLSSVAEPRQALFFLVVSQKQARVYQVPVGAAGWSAAAAPGAAASGGQGGTGSGSQGTSTTTNEAPAVSSSSSSPGSQMAESPLCKLLTNKRNLLAECELSATSYSCHSQLVQWRSPDECCLVSYLATGNIVINALPRLKPVLLDADFEPCSRANLARTLCFARNGHCLYQPSQGEICKFTLSSSYKSLVNEMLGILYVPRDMPEQPRANFFKSLFSVSQANKQSDRDELFGECSSGKASRNVAKHVGSAASGSLSAMDKLKSSAVGTMGHEMRVAREGLDERGERLGELEDRTLNMLNQSESYSHAAHQLAQKFKDKKWYQF